ncbi:Amino acid permease 2 [Linum perenne]
MVADNGELPYLRHEHAALDVSMDTASHIAGNCFDDDGRPKRTGTPLLSLSGDGGIAEALFHSVSLCTLWTASAHVITAVIGSGVLSLAWSTAQLGWIAGPTVLFLFSFVTYYTSTLLAACYRTGDPDTGKRNYTYMDAVQSTLGGFYVKVCGYVQYINLFGVAIGYTIASSISMMAVKRSNCFHSSGQKDPCHMNANPYMVAFGVAEILLSQIPDFDQLSWLSMVAAVMSFTYSGIGLGLGIGKVIGNKHIKGSLTGIGLGHVTPIDKVWRSFQALGGVAFAYSFSNILIEIQDTIKSPPSEATTMKKASLISITVTTFFYMLCGCFGYAAFGDLAPENLLTGFGFYNPFWLVDIANIAIVIHLVGAYQVFCQPIYAFVEKIAKNKYPDSSFITKEIRIPLGTDRHYNLNLFRLVWRTVFVITTTIISMMLPFFSSIVGLLGAFGFWPLTVYFPVEMYISQKKIPKWSTRWMCLEILSVACLFISIAATVGSIAEIVADLKTVKLFHMTY